MAKQGEAAAGPGATSEEQVSAGAAIMGKSQTGAHPRQARPGGALGLPRGAGAGPRVCSLAERVARRCVVSDPPLPLLTLLAAMRMGQKDAAAAAAVDALPPGSSAADKAAAKAEAIDKVDVRRKADSAAGGEQLRCKCSGRRAHPHRPGPGEPSGFLVVPGRGCARTGPRWAGAAVALVATSHP